MRLEAFKKRTRFRPLFCLFISHFPNFSSNAIQSHKTLRNRDLGVHSFQERTSVTFITFPTTIYSLLAKRSILHCIMSTMQHRRVLTSATQSICDLFRWRTRTTRIDENGHEYVEYESPRAPPNPIRIFTQLTLLGWCAYLVGFAAWTADAFDFHALSIQTTKLSKHFGVSKTRVTEAITLTLLLRSVGAAVFGVFADYFGRKYPLVLNMWFLGALQIGSIYAKTFNQFLATRARAYCALEQSDFFHGEILQCI